MTKRKEEISGKKRLYLKDFTSNTNGMDLGFIRRRFTWENNHEGLASIKERLDRAVVNTLWMEIYPEVIIKHLRMEISDHCPILILINKKTFKGFRSFRFL